jgi:hypothetical protein
MKAWHFLAAVLAVGIYVGMRPPSAGKIARQLEVDLDAGMMRYDGIAYTAHWSERTTWRGDVRHVARAHTRRMPVVLFHLVLTSGDFSRPEIVTVDHTGGGSYVWRADRQPRGSLVVLHLVPESVLAYRTMRSLEAGDRVEIVGREESRGFIEREDGAYLRLGHDNHRLVLVNRVERTQP